ncbi:STAS domain-containing protein [Kitasatospora sp. KL5]|uniref:STAS domain-containing protein n=1 Tax=Kitasatospora sp. KL5 TaxID=3425125 RepID=UPI003D6F2D5D
MRPELRITHRTGPDGVRVVEVAGDADMDTADRLRAAILRAVAAEPAAAAVVVDCSGLEFCAAAGLNELLRGREAALGAGIAFRLAAPARQMRQLLRLTETDRVFVVDRARPRIDGPDAGLPEDGRGADGRGPLTPVRPQ